MYPALSILAFVQTAQQTTLLISAYDSDIRIFPADSRRVKIRCRVRLSARLGVYARATRLLLQQLLAYQSICCAARN